LTEPPTDDDGSDDAQTPLSANQFGLSDDDLDALLDEVESGPDIDDLLDAAEGDDDLDALLDEVESGPDIDELLEQATARQWGTPEGDWWP